MDKMNLTPEESIHIISKSIANFKMNYKDNAKTFLLWGWFLTMASFSHYFIIMILEARKAYGYMGLFSFGTWGVFILCGFIAQVLLSRKMQKSKSVYSFLDGYLQKLWTATYVSMFIAIFVCVRLEIVPPAVLLIIAGIATTTTGLFLKFKPLTMGGIAFFISALAVTFVSWHNSLLITGAAIICGYLIPGYLLKSAKE